MGVCDIVDAWLAKALAEGSRYKHLVVIADCCHAGAQLVALGDKQDILLKLAAERASTVTVVASTAPDSVSYASAGVFFPTFVRSVSQLLGLSAVVLRLCRYCAGLCPVLACPR
jgi:hypothetical protein